MTKQIAPIWGNHTTNPLRLGPYEDIEAADWGGMQRRNHRTYAYEGQVSAQMFWPAPGRQLTATLQPLIFSRGSTPNSGGFTYVNALRPHLGETEFKVKAFGSAFTLSILVIGLGGSVDSTTPLSRSSTTPDWAEATIEVPADSWIRVLAQAFGASPSADTRIYALSVAERILEEADL